jgi:hypothetical protein
LSDLKDLAALRVCISPHLLCNRKNGQGRDTFKKTVER